MKQLSIAVLLLLSGCTDPAEDRKADQNYFFDLKGYFTREAGRLSEVRKPAEKEVTRNGSVERRVLMIDWDTELALFRESDINKAAWKDSYRTNRSGNTTTYTATDDDLRTRQIVLEKAPGGQFRHIRIRNRASNFLYTSTETLDYYPDSAYRIDRTQSVKVIGMNHYTIKTKLE